MVPSAQLAKQIAVVHRPIARRARSLQLQPAQLARRVTPRLRPLEPAADHPHQRRLAGSPRRLDPDCERRLGVGVLDPEGDRVGVHVVADRVLVGPDVAPDRFGLVTLRWGCRGGRLRRRRRGGDVSLEDRRARVLGRNVGRDARLQRTGDWREQQEFARVEQLLQVGDADQALAAPTPATSPGVLEPDEPGDAIEREVERDTVQQDGVTPDHRCIRRERPANGDAVDKHGFEHRLVPRQSGCHRPALEQRTLDRVDVGAS